MEKYSWDFNGEAEHWRNDPCDTVEECIAAARRAVEQKDYQTDEPPKTVFIGENVQFAPSVDPETVLEHVEEDASEFAGEVGDDWEAYDQKKKDELNELGDSLTHIVNEWLKKYGYEPDFYAIQNIKPYQL